MATSGTRTFSMNLDEIIRASLRKIGVGSPKSGEWLNAKQSLNVMVNAWQDQGVYLWTRSNAMVLLTADTATVVLPSTVIDVEDNAYFHREGQDYPITQFTRDNYREQPTKDEVGNPNRYYVDYQLANPTAYFWPVYDKTTGFVLGTDSNSYLCILNHTSAAANKPITGADYATYWELTTLQTSSTAWVTATDYDSGVVYTTHILRVQDFVNTTDTPDATVRWLEALIYNNALRLAPEHAIPLRERESLKEMAIYTLAMAKAGNQEESDLRLMPRLR